MIVLVSHDFEVNSYGADLIEWRDPSIDLVTRRYQLKVPLLITLKKVDVLLIETLKPDYIDLPWDTSLEDLASVSHYQLILSYHNYEETPKDLLFYVETMQVKKANFIKVATFCKSTADALCLLQLAKSRERVTAQGMGVRGEITRILGPCFGMPMTYAVKDCASQTISGQLSIEELCITYRFKRLSKATALYGLIGDPVDMSVSHCTHNLYFALHQRDAVYVKMVVTQEELKETLPMLSYLGFRGLSVTMPLKETVQKYLGLNEPVNTLICQETGSYVGCSTDGKAVLEALENVIPLKQASILILGAGGAAKSIASALFRSGFTLVFSSRNEKVSKQLAAFYRGTALSWDHLKGEFDCVVNATPIDPPVDFQGVKVLFDIRQRAFESLLVQRARVEKCRVLLGWDMFWRQAKEQFRVWFNTSSIV